MNYQIEDTAVPARIGGVTNGPLSLDGFPFGALEVGKSFFVPNHESGRARAVPFTLAKQTFPERKFRRVKDSVTSIVNDAEGNPVTVTTNGFRYGRIK